MKTMFSRAVSITAPLLLIASLFLAACGGGGVVLLSPELERDRIEAQAAVDAVNIAVRELNTSSTDAEVSAVEALIQIARNEIADLPLSEQAAQLMSITDSVQIVKLYRVRLNEAAANAATIADLRRQVNEANQRVSDLEDDLENAQQDVRDANQRVSDLEDDLDDAQQDVRTAKEAARTAGEKLDEAKRLAAAGDEEAQQRISELQDAKDAADQRVTDSEAQVSGLQDDLRGARQDVRDAEDARDQAISERDAARAEVKRLQAIHAEAEAKKLYDVIVGGTMSTSFDPDDADKMTINTNHNWDGVKYTMDGDDVYEARVYSNVGPTIIGKKFGHKAAANSEFQYMLDPQTGVLKFISGAVSKFVSSPQFDHSSGAKRFELPERMISVEIAGVYHGVSGLYYCVPSGNTSTCAVRVEDDGFSLGGVVNSDGTFSVSNAAWTFKPTNPNDRVSMKDENYAQYGWWMESDGTLDVFHDFEGTDPTVTTPDAGTATYIGGAAGKYSLHSSTGGTNDSGSFTADVELNAEFGDTDMISGTVDNFMGNDGQPRDWSVELKESTVSGVTATGMTVWTMRGRDEPEESGSWTSTFREQGDDGVPSVVTGTFQSEFAHEGKMIGAFGANKE